MFCYYYSKFMFFFWFFPFLLFSVGGYWCLWYWTHRNKNSIIVMKIWSPPQVVSGYDSWTHLLLLNKFIYVYILFFLNFGAWDFLFCWTGSMRFLFPVQNWLLLSSLIARTPTDLYRLNSAHASNDQKLRSSARCLKIINALHFVH